MPLRVLRSSACGRPRVLGGGKISWLPFYSPFTTRYVDERPLLSCNVVHHGVIVFGPARRRSAMCLGNL